MVTVTMSLAAGNPTNGLIIIGHKHKSIIQLNDKEMKQTISVVIRSNFIYIRKKEKQKTKKKKETKNKRKMKRNNNKILF